MPLTWTRALTALTLVVASCQCFVIPNHSLRLQRRLIGSSAVDKVNSISPLTRRRRVLAKSSFMDGSGKIQEPSTSVDAMNSVAALNAAAIALFTLAAGYELLHVDVRAAIALFQNNDSMEASALGTTIDLFLRLPTDSIRSYEALVPTNPIFYKACTSGVAYTIGDFVSQVYQGRNLETIDLKRSARSGAAGFIGHGPLCHYWMSFMETYLDFGGAWWGTGVKVLADQTVWSLYLNAVYSGLIGILAGRPLTEVWRDVRSTSWPALRTSWRFWPFVHTVSFSHAIPLDLKLLWVDAMEVVWVTLLSKVANDDKEAANTLGSTTDNNLKTEVVQQRQGQAPMFVVDDDVADPATEVVMMAALEKSLSQSNGASASPAALEAKNLGQDAQALVGKAWTAGWPLAAMWPFLYASYLLEKGLSEGAVPLS